MVSILDFGFSYNIQITTLEFEMSQVINTDFLLNYIHLKEIDAGFQEFLAAKKIAKNLKYHNLDEDAIKQLCLRINKKPEQQHSSEELEIGKRSSEWKNGQFKLFIWVAIFYAFKEGKPSYQLADSDLLFFRTAFTERSHNRIKFQLINLFPFDGFYRKHWKNTQVQLLVSLVQRQLNQNRKLQWKSIAFKLFQESQGVYFRTFGQCREMWNNHLDPNVTKDKWSLEEDHLLLTLAKERKKHWSKIAQKFKGCRTVHMVKNRYHSIIRRQKRKKDTKKLSEKEIAAKALKLIFFQLKQKQLQAQIQADQKIKNAKKKNKQNRTPNDQNQVELDMKSLSEELIMLPSLQFQCLDSFQNEFLSKNLKKAEIENLLNKLKPIDFSFSNQQMQIKEESLFEKLCSYEESFQEMNQEFSYSLDLE